MQIIAVVIIINAMLSSLMLVACLFVCWFNCETTVAAVESL